MGDSRLTARDGRRDRLLSRTSGNQSESPGSARSSTSTTPMRELPGPPRSTGWDGNRVVCTRRRPGSRSTLLLPINRCPVGAFSHSRSARMTAIHRAACGGVKARRHLVPLLGASGATSVPLRKRSSWRSKRRQVGQVLGQVGPANAVCRPLKSGRLFRNIE